MKYLNPSYLFVLLTLLLGFSSCVDNDFDQPVNTISISPDIVVTVASVLERIDEAPVEFTDSVYVSGVITADDESGNFFKLLTFQDETGALSIALDQNELNAKYTEGNTFYVLLKGLTLARDAGMPRLGLGVVGGRLQRVPDVLVDKFCVAGGPVEERKVEPTPMTIDEFASNPDMFLNKLVILENVEFSAGDLGQPYATADSPDGPQTENRTIVNCQGDDIILRNSGFANFVSDILPAGNGSMLAIASVFNNDLQLFIRDTDDLMFAGDRCDGSGGQADNEITIKSIQESFYTLGVDKVAEGYITGIVISDKNTGQVNNQNLYIQNGSEGILVRFSNQHNFNLGDRLQITVTGNELSEFRGLLQINNVSLVNAIRQSNGALPAARELTIAEIKANNNDYESTRVLIKGATLDSDGTFAFNVGVDDGTGTVNIFTFETTSFAGESVPTGVVDVTAIVSQFNDDVQLIINGPSDISGGTTGSNDTELLEDFQGGTAGEDVEITGWINVAIEGNRRWTIAEFMGEKTAQCEGFQDPDPQTLAWLVTPTINTADYKAIKFESQMAFWEHEGLSVWISPSFNDIGDADWVEIEGIRLPEESDEFYSPVGSGNITLEDYFSGDVKVGFRYEGTAAQNTTKIRIDNIVLTKN